MKIARVRVRLFVPPPEQRYYRVRCLVRKSAEISRKSIESDISATGVDLHRFNADGTLRINETAPKWLQEEIKLFYSCSCIVAEECDKNGTLRDISSKDLTDKVRALVHLTKNDRERSEGAL